jgi:hypothetical protein
MGWKRLAAFCVLLVASASLADAHGPTRQKVKESVEINAPAGKVWARIANFHDFSWHPAVARTEGSGGNQPQAKRILTLQGGGVIEEVLESYAPEKMTFSYSISKVDVKVLPVTNYASRITVKAIDGGRTLVEWQGGFYRGYPNNDPPPELNDEAAVKAVIGVYRAGLDALKSAMESGGS